MIDLPEKDKYTQLHKVFGLIALLSTPLHASPVFLFFLLKTSPTPSFDFIYHLSIAVILPVAGNFSEWSDWGPCSSSCGTGTQNRTRTCTNPPPINNGSDCEGVRVEERLCNGSSCPGRTSYSVKYD